MGMIELHNKVKEIKKVMAGSNIGKGYFTAVFNKSTSRLNFHGGSGYKWIVDESNGYIYPAKIADSEIISTDDLPAALFKKDGISEYSYVEDPMKLRLPVCDTKNHVVLSKGEVIQNNSETTKNESSYDLINDILTIFENSF